ncbi:MAG: 2-hydroxyacyl-CoA dehydratase, partial [Planctomycetes bacterium]|nr:2-hydroxyacyl-CoA dehydratase [Planctomycetota bacterium]
MGFGDETVGITSTVPIEIIFASGRKPLDLNNVFVASPNRDRLVEQAEAAGFPRTTCCWIKGLYSAAKQADIRTMVGLVEGDCSNTMALLEILESEGVRVIPFAYPYKRDEALLRLQLSRFAAEFGVKEADAEAMKARLDRVRRLAHEIDDLTWRDGKVTGEENHLWTISCSDMMGDIALYERKASEFLSAAKARPPASHGIRLGFIGIPPICDGFYSFVEGLGARIVFNELQRQFAMPYATRDLYDQYSRFTYPYDIFFRLADVQAEIQRRRL